MRRRGIDVCRLRLLSFHSNFRLLAYSATCQGDSGYEGLMTPPASEMSRSSDTPHPARRSSPRPSSPTPAWSTASARSTMGTTVTDFDEEEIARKHTLSASLALRGMEQAQDQPDRRARHRQLPQRGARGAPVADAALIVVDAVAGVMVQTEKVWEAADELELPRMIVLNRHRSRAREPARARWRRCASRAAAR